MLVSDIPLRASRPRRRLIRILPIALEDSTDPEFTDDGVDEASQLHFLPPAPDSPVPSLCETSPEENVSPVLPTSPSPEMTFDAFMSELEDKAESAPLKPASSFETRYRMRVSIIRKQAAEREQQRVHRQQAAARIQRWYLRTIAVVKARRVLESQLNKHITIVKTIQAARRVTKAVRKFAEMRRMAKQEVWKRYREVCAVLIQKRIRGYLARRRYRQTMWERYEGVRRLVLGLKVRRVLKLPQLRALKDQIAVSMDPEETHSLHQAFTNAFSLHLLSPWKSLTPRPFIQRGRVRKGARSPAPSSPTRSISSSWSAVRQRQQSACPAADRKLQKKTVSRRGNTIISQKLTWNNTKSKIDCWNSPKKTTVIDFPKIEKSPNRKKIPIPLSKNDDCIPDSSNTTEAPSAADTCKPSFIPLIHPCSAFITGLRAVDMEELRDIRRLLQEAFEIIKRG